MVVVLKDVLLMQRIVTEDDLRWMGEALAEAEKAERIGEVPVGAVVVLDGAIVGRGHNRRETSFDPTSHAEILALRDASEQLQRWRLTGCTMYVTLEPCPMCAGALVNARVDNLVFGATDPKAGSCGSLYNIPCDERLNHRLDVLTGVRADEASLQLRSFFRKRRSKSRRDGRVVEGA